MGISASLSDDGKQLRFRLGDKELATMPTARADALATYLITTAEGNTVAVAQEDFHNVFRQLQPEEAEKVHTLSLATIFDISFLVDAAASAGNLNEVKRLLSFQETTPDLTNAIDSAAAGGHHDVVELLLSQGQIPPGKLGNAIDSAAAGGHRDVVELLLSQGQISQDKLGNAMYAAAQNGHLGMVKLLLSQGQIPPDKLGNAMNLAVVSRHRDVVELLLSQGQIPPDKLGDAMDLALSSGRRDVVELLLSQGQIPPDKLHDAMYSALDFGNCDEVELLLSQGQIPPDKLHDAMSLAVSRGYRDVVKLLLNQLTRLNDNQLDDAINSAAYNGHGDVVKLLLSQGQISPDKLGDAMYSAAYNGHLDVVELLLSQGQISQDKLGDAMYAAAQNGHLGMVKLLSTRSPDFDVSLAVITASDSGHHEVVDFLLHHWPISEQTREDAFNVAAFMLDPDREAMVSMLQPTTTEYEIYPNAIHISFKELKENPLNYLNFFSRLETFPPYFVDKDSPAFDAGGVTRQVVTVLMEELVKQNIIPLSPTGLPMIREGSEENDKAMMNKLGHFYSLLEQRNATPDSTPSTTGAVFHPTFFEIVKAVAEASPEEDLVPKVAEILSKADPSFELAKDVIVNPTDANKAKYAKDIMGSEDEADQAPEAAKQFVSQYVDAAKCFYQSVNKDFEKKIKDTEAQSFCADIQGEEATAAVILHALRVDPKYQNPLFSQQVEWLKEFIESKDDAWRRQFLKTVTGSTSLPAGAEITIRPTPTEQLFAIATCFMSIQMPVMNMSREQYLQYLDEVFSSPDDFTDA